MFGIYRRLVSLLFPSISNRQLIVVTLIVVCRSIILLVIDAVDVNINDIDNKLEDEEESLLLSAVGNRSSNHPNNNNNNNNKDSEDFYRLLTDENEVYVDKTMLIVQFVKSEHRVTVLTRPYGWGKSVNMDMVKRFLQVEVNRVGKQLPKEECVNYKLFVGGRLDWTDNGRNRTKLLKPLKISRYGNYMGLQGEFPVISISFGSVRGNTYQRIVKSMKEVVSDLFRRHNYLSEMLRNRNYWKIYKAYYNGHFNDNQLEESLCFLTKLLCSHFQQKVYVLIDDFDAPIINLMYEMAVKMRGGGDNNHHHHHRWKSLDYGPFFDKIFRSLDFDHTLSLIQGMYHRCLVDNKALKKAFLTGTVLIDLGDSLNNNSNIVRYTLSENEYGDFYGLSQEDVDQMLSEVRFKQNTSTVIDRESFKIWYGGYNFAGKVKYTIGSLVACLKNGGRLDDYYHRNHDEKRTPISDLIFSSHDVQIQLRDLLSGVGLNTIDTGATNCTIPFNVTERGLISFLFYNGYLNPHHIFKEKRLSVPNREIRTILKKKILKWTCESLNVSRRLLESVADHLSNFRLNEFTNDLQERMLSSIPTYWNRGYDDEIDSNLYYTGIAWSLSYLLEKNYLALVDRVSTLGKIDFLLVAKPDTSYRNAIIAKGRLTKSMKYAKRSTLTGFSSFGKTKIGLLSRIDLTAYEHIEQILWMSFAFARRNLTLNYKIEHTATRNTTNSY